MTHRNAFTLVELLLVVFLITLVALSATTAVSNSEQQIRHEDTLNRLAAIRTAILGDTRLRDGNGQPLASGFVADVGRLPKNLLELLERPDEIPAFTFDPTYQLHAGWRGPYLEAAPSLSGNPRYPDGWGNPPLEGDPEHFFGWKFNDVVETNFDLQSRGEFGRDDGTEYEIDLPTTPLINADDHLADLRSRGFSVRIMNDGSEEELRLRLVYPLDGSFDWIEDPLPETASEKIDLLPYMSHKETAPASSESTLTFWFTDPSPSADPTAESKPIPAGRRALIVVDADTGQLVAHEDQAPIPLPLLPRTTPSSPYDLGTWDLQ